MNEQQIDAVSEVNMLEEHQVFLDHAIRIGLPAHSAFEIRHLVEQENGSYTGTTTAEASISWFWKGDCYYFQVGVMPVTIVYGNSDTATVENNDLEGEKLLRLHVTLESMFHPLQGAKPVELNIMLTEMRYEFDSYQGFIDRVEVIGDPLANG